MRYKVLAAVFTVGLACFGFFSHADPDRPYSGIAVAFPWDSIDGVWEAKDSASGTQFSFEVLTTDNEKALRVVQFDIATGRVLAEGSGVQTDMRANSVTAIMKRVDDGSEFLVSLLAYKEEKSNRRFTIINVRKGGSVEQGDSFILRRVSYTPMRLHK